MAFRPGKYYVNSPLRLTVNFQDDDGDDTDPTGVLIKVMSPSGVSTTYTLGRDSEVQYVNAGDYTADITPDEAGRWRFRWETTGTGTTLAVEGDFLVQYSAFYDTYGTDYGI
jgi:hypothetical protein